MQLRIDGNNDLSYPHYVSKQKTARGTLRPLAVFLFAYTAPAGFEPATHGLGNRRSIR